MNKHRIATMLKLKYLIHNWDDLSNAKDATHKGVILNLGVCGNIALVHSIDCPGIPLSYINDFINLDGSLSTNPRYPVDGYLNYLTENNKYNNPKRLEFIKYVLNRYYLDSSIIERIVYGGLSVKYVRSSDINNSKFIAKETNNWIFL